MVQTLIKHIHFIMRPQLYSKSCLYYIEQTNSFVEYDRLFFLLGRQINNFSQLMRFHLFIQPSTLKVKLITIFTNQPNCVIEVKKNCKPKVQSWFLYCTFLATKGGTSNSTSFFFHVFFDSVSFLVVIQPSTTNHTN